MDKFKVSVLALAIFFLGFLALIGSLAGIVQMTFMALVYLFRKQLRSRLRRITNKNYALVIVFGTLLGLVEEMLWYASDRNIGQTMFNSLSEDLVSTLPAYMIFFTAVYVLSQRRKLTQRKIFLYGGIFGYIFYFIAESGLFGFQFGGIPNAPMSLLLIWEINNFFLNGFLAWFPLYLSDLPVDKEPL